MCERLERLCSLGNVREGGLSQITRIIWRLCDMSATRIICWLDFQLVGRGEWLYFRQPRREVERLVVIDGKLHFLL